MQRARLVDDGTNTVRLDDAPDEERDTRNGDDDCLNCKEVATIEESER